MKAHPIADIFPMMGEEELEALVNSMRANGYDPSHPILTYDGLILDGRNRYLAATQAGVTPLIVEWNAGNPWDFVWRENAVRRHLEASQKAACAIVFADGSEAWQAAQRVAKETANRKRSEATTAQHAVSNPRAGETSGRVSRDTRPEMAHIKRPVPPNAERTKIAALAGVSPATVARALAVQARSPEQFERVKRGELSASKALNESKLADKRALAEKIRDNPVVTPDGRYQVIAIDPPWKYDSRAEDTTHRGKNLYPDMTVAEICALPVVSLAQDDCILWLWVTNAFMRGAFSCLDAWGFQEKTILTWDKVNLGLGDYLRNVTEHCILAVRGRPVLSLTNQTTIIRETRREHSRKPEAFYSLAEALCPGSKLEMFARTPREGWSRWGAESEKFTGSR